MVHSWRETCSLSTWQRLRSGQCNGGSMKIDTKPYSLSMDGTKNIVVRARYAIFIWSGTSATSWAGRKGRPPQPCGQIPASACYGGQPQTASAGGVQFSQVKTCICGHISSSLSPPPSRLTRRCSPLSFLDTFISPLHSCPSTVSGRIRVLKRRGGCIKVRPAFVAPRAAPAHSSHDIELEHRA